MRAGLVPHIPPDSRAPRCTSERHLASRRVNVDHRHDLARALNRQGPPPLAGQRRPAGSRELPVVDTANWLIERIRRSATSLEHPSIHFDASPLSRPCRRIDVARSSKSPDPSTNVRTRPSIATPNPSGPARTSTSSFDCSTRGQRAPPARRRDHPPFRNAGAASAQSPTSCRTAISASSCLLFRRHESGADQIPHASSHDAQLAGAWKVLLRPTESSPRGSSNPHIPTSSSVRIAHPCTLIASALGRFDKIRTPHQ